MSNLNQLYQLVKKSQEHFYIVEQSIFPFKMHRNQIQMLILDQISRNRFLCIISKQLFST